MNRGKSEILFPSLFADKMYQDAQGKLTSNILDVSSKVEYLLLEEFRNASIASYQSKEETTNTFNVYLTAMGIAATGIAVLSSFIIDSLKGDELYRYYLFESIMFIVLFITSIISFTFFTRFIQLTKENFRNIEVMNSIREYHIQESRQPFNIGTANAYQAI